MPSDFIACPNTPVTAEMTVIYCEVAMIGHSSELEQELDCYWNMLLQGDARSSTVKVVALGILRLDFRPNNLLKMYH